eukprot:CAMPEP_0194289970 /NCGR_PEP_ID=MMETSP0169-20130528/40293_1 /TAXON_ID=218684 /ORGANISM="Corethron pennatum, Strain L29A3" /LENGTH=546 /DNA_ID=CAMNT_0039037415 /DNA_START=123 /DNA_END=1763 /DNA_ORIENTATION=+
MKLFPSLLLLLPLVLSALLVGRCVSDDSGIVTNGTEADGPDISDDPDESSSVRSTRWAELPRDASMPRGAHVRLNMSTGNRSILVYSDDGLPAIIRDGDDGRNETAVATATEDGAEAPDLSEAPADKYDYGMMYGVLSGLPEEERARMGLHEVPHPDTLPRGASDADFQEKMKRIWFARQQEVRSFMEAHVIDVPDVLRQLIATLDDASAPADDVASALLDLEDLLGDVDMARDFHTLGGWGTLVRISTGRDPRGVGGAGRAAALRCAGAAVRNVGEFRPWAAEAVVTDDGGVADAVGAALGALASRNARVRDAAVFALGSLVRYNDVGMELLIAREGAETLEKYYEKYASAVTEAMRRSKADSGDSDSPETEAAGFKADLKIALRLLSLSTDVVTMGEECLADAAARIEELEGEGADASEQTARKIWCSKVIGAFSTEGWCSNFLVGPSPQTHRLTMSPAEQEKILAGIISTGGACDRWHRVSGRQGGDDGELASQLTVLGKRWERMDTGGSIDIEWLGDLMSMLYRAVEVVGGDYDGDSSDGEL